MSITANFEKQKSTILAIDPFKPRTTIQTVLYPAPVVEELMVHARALEAMLKKTQFNGTEDCAGCCQVCFGQMEHESDCQLAKLLDGVV